LLIAFYITVTETFWNSGRIQKWSFTKMPSYSWCSSSCSWS